MKFSWFQKLKNTKIQLSNLYIGFVGFATLVIFAKTLFVTITQVETIGVALFLSVDWFVSKILWYAIPLSFIFITLARFFPVLANEELEFTKQEILETSSLVIEHIRILDDPDELEKLFVSKVIRIRDLIENPDENYLIIKRTSQEILEETRKRPVFLKTTVGQELLKFVFIVQEFLMQRLKLN